jgi:Glu-tRNA(Gln) amidotransferase subunit E-like FAD-binding protein
MNPVPVKVRVYPEKDIPTIAVCTEGEIVKLKTIYCIIIFIFI